ncbi:hypothetical protein PQX77_010519 [Marasmius sp. AFHP31]|nr:hypothetical protein PQX77_010519 [Marasmius sp. AFHP31]
MPALESMEIYMITSYRHIRSAWLDRPNAIKAPKLRSLTCRGAVFENFPDPLVSASLSFTSLTTISASVTPSIAEIIFRQTCPYLISAHFVVLSPIDRTFPHEMDGPDSGYNEFDGANSDPQIVPCLRSLALETSPSSWELWRNSFRGIWKILQGITCPELTSLGLVADCNIRQYTPIHDRHFDIRPALLGFLERSKSSEKLETLRFERVPIIDHYLIEVLKRVPRLQNLRVHEAKIDEVTSTGEEEHVAQEHGEEEHVEQEHGEEEHGEEEDCLSEEPNHILTPTLFRMLTCSSSTCPTSETPMLPELRRIVFESQTDWPDRSLETMIRSRVRGNCAPLEYVVLKVSDGMHQSCFPLVDSLRREERLMVRVVATVPPGVEVEVLGSFGEFRWFVLGSGTCQMRGLS